MMMADRLKVLEYRRFGTGQLLATRYQRGEATDLIPAAAAVVADVADDTRASSAGPGSLGRVAMRFALDPDEWDVDRRKAPTLGPMMIIAARAGVDRRIAALRCLAASFATAAVEVGARK
jgi:hypothetical protein